MSASVKKRTPPGDYASLVRRIRTVVKTALPATASVLVVGKGDREIVKLGPRRVGHFPQNEAGHYAGHHPADASAAIRHLESLRADGAEYLLLPRTAYWWVDHYQDLFAHLDRHGNRVQLPTDDCRIWSLGKREPKGEHPGHGSGARSQAVSAGVTGGEVREVRTHGRALDSRIEGLLDALFGPEVSIVQLRLESDPEIRAAVRRIRSVEAPDPRDREFGETLAALRDEGSDAVILLAPESADRWFATGSTPLRMAVERWLPRIAHRDHLCSIYDLRRVGQPHVRAGRTTTNGRPNA